MSIGTCRRASERIGLSTSIRLMAARKGWQTSTRSTMHGSTAFGTVSFRQSCIYGRRQFGIEDQGWIAWFAIAAILGKPITIYGDGKQIRDALHVKDLARAYELAFEHRDRVVGQAFNIGGGPDNTLSLLELIAYLEEDLGITIPLAWGDWRAGDQPVFVCALDKAERLLDWKPEIGVREGVRDLIAWVSRQQASFQLAGSRAR